MFFAILLKFSETSISRLFSYAAWADKFDGSVHDVPIRGVTLAMNEPLGVVGAVCPEEHPLLGFISIAAPLIATGNRCVIIPSASYPNIAINFYQILERNIYTLHRLLHKSNFNQ
mgnify:CR=1 FL=1